MTSPITMASIMTSINVITNLARENQKLHGEITGSLRKLLHAATMIQWDLLKNEGADEDLTLLMQELLCDIDDFISDISNPEKVAAIFKSAFRGVSAVDARPREIQLIESFLDTIKIILDWPTDISKEATASTDFPPAVAPYAPEKDLDGVDTSKLLELLSPAHGGQLRLISIVGCSGLGKTRLAKAFYEETIVQKSQLITEIGNSSPYNYKAWIDVSMCKDVEDFINEISKKTSGSLNKFLLRKRFLIILDDLQSCCIRWKDVEHLFPENKNDSRIIVTTNVNSIARDYSSGGYYVYPLQCLGEAESEELFWKRVRGNMSYTDPEGVRSKDILAKCGGLPIAIVTAGNFCSRGKNPHLSEEIYKEVCTELTNIVTSEQPMFRDMKRMFVRCYNRLKDRDQRICLLNFSIYPKGHQIKSKKIARRLDAEGLVVEEIATKCLNDLSDQSMICTNDKRCQVQQMMLEFATYKSLSRNLVTLIEKGTNRSIKSDMTVQRRVIPKSRRLSIHCTSTTSSNLIPEDIGVSAVRSLIVFKTNPSAETRVDAVDFKRFKVMRVLDLEGCKGLTNTSGVFDSIFELLLLKHLNLKNTDINQIPTKIDKLKHLEMLDVRHTRVGTLPMEVIMLPELAHLFGEFVLPALTGKGKADVTMFLKTRSKLQTLDGIIIKKSSCFDIVIGHARKLTRVKICGNTCTALAAPSRASIVRNLMCFSAQSGQEDTQVPKVQFRRVVGTLVSTLQDRFDSLDSVSIESGDISRAFLGCSMGGSTFRYIKLRGPLQSLPVGQLQTIHTLRKLHLFSTRLSSNYLADALQSLKCLKLGEEDIAGSWDGNFCVRKDGFPSLRELCFKGAKKYPRVEIKEGAMTVLASLELLCPYPPAVEVDENPNSLMRVEGIEHLKSLDEVILHYTADDATVNAWESTAREHMNMPCVKKQGKPAQPAVNCAA